MLHLLRATALLLLSASLAAAPAPATRPAKPLTYAELKAENDRLKARVAELEKIVAQIEAERQAKVAAAAGKEIKVGMTLKEAEALAVDGKAFMAASSEDLEVYKMVVAAPSGEAWQYVLQVRGGKIVSFERSPVRTPGLRAREQR